MAGAIVRPERGLGMESKTMKCPSLVVAAMAISVQPLASLPLPVKQTRREGVMNVAQRIAHSPYDREP